MKTIRVLWVIGSSMLVVALQQPAVGLIFKAVAVLLLFIAWSAAMYRTIAAREKRWFWILLLAPPGIAMWFYIFRRDEPQGQPVPPPPPTQFRRRRPLGDVQRAGGATPRLPLAIRQALDAIRDAEQRYPEW